MQRSHQGEDSRSSVYSLDCLYLGYNGIQTVASLFCRHGDCTSVLTGYCTIQVRAEMDDKKADSTTGENQYEPTIESDDIQERLAARRLRIQRRLEAARR